MFWYLNYRSYTIRLDFFDEDTRIERCGSIVVVGRDFIDRVYGVFTSTLFFRYYRRVDYISRFTANGVRGGDVIFRLDRRDYVGRAFYFNVSKRVSKGMVDFDRCFDS